MTKVSARRHSQAYSPYGYAPQAATLLLGFNGGRFDPSMKAYALGNGHRFYQPSLSRFMSPDSLSPFGAGGINAYCYCLGDPINRYDPTGRVSKLWGRAMEAFRRSRIERLPNELLEHVASQLTGPDLAAFSQTSKRMQEVASPLLQKSQERFYDRLLTEPGTSDKMVLALKVIFGLEPDIHPGAANSLEVTREQMENLILDTNRKHYEPQVTAITIRQAQEAAARGERLQHALAQQAFMPGIR